MQPLLFSFFLAATAVLVSAADTPSLNGSWQIHNSVAGNESDQSCKFTQKESDLAGDCSSENGAVHISGKVDGKQVSWTYKSEYNGGPITLTYKGTFQSANKVTGTVNVAEYGVDGDFTATLSK